MESTSPSTTATTDIPTTMPSIPHPSPSSTDPVVATTMSTAEPALAQAKVTLIQARRKSRGYGDVPMLRPNYVFPPAAPGQPTSPSTKITVHTEDSAQEPGTESLALSTGSTDPSLLPSLGQKNQYLKTHYRTHSRNGSTVTVQDLKQAIAAVSIDLLQTTPPSEASEASETSEGFSQAEAASEPSLPEETTTKSRLSTVITSQEGIGAHSSSSAEASPISSSSESTFPGSSLPPSNSQDPLKQVNDPAASPLAPTVQPTLTLNPASKDRPVASAPPFFSYSIPHEIPSPYASPRLHLPGGSTSPLPSSPFARKHKHIYHNSDQQYPTDTITVKLSGQDSATACAHQLTVSDPTDESRVYSENTLLEEGESQKKEQEQSQEQKQQDGKESISANQESASIQSPTVVAVAAASQPYRPPGSRLRATQETRTSVSQPESLGLKEDSTTAQSAPTAALTPLSMAEGSGQETNADKALPEAPLSEGAETELSKPRVPRLTRLATARSAQNLTLQTVSEDSARVLFSPRSAREGQPDYFSMRPIQHLPRTPMTPGGDYGDDDDDYYGRLSMVTTPMIQNGFFPNWAKGDAQLEELERIRNFLSARKYPDEMPLSDEWTLFFSDTSRAKDKTQVQDAYSSAITPLFTCHTVPQFATSWKYVRERVRPATMKVNQNLHWFKKGIKPMWEDPKNKYGGRLTICPPRALLDIVWETVLILMAGDVLDHHGEGTGAVFARRARGDRVEVWLGSDDTPESLAHIRGRLIQELTATGADELIRTAKYKKHFDARREEKAKQAAAAAAAAAALAAATGEGGEPLAEGATVTSETTSEAVVKPGVAHTNGSSSSSIQSGANSSATGTAPSVSERDFQSFQDFAQQQQQQQQQREREQQEARKERERIMQLGKERLEKERAERDRLRDVRVRAMAAAAMAASEAKHQQQLLLQQQQQQQQQ